MKPHLVLLLAAASASGEGEATLRGRTLAEWRGIIEPSPEEFAFTEMPWRPSLWSAVEEAHASERPLLLWVMNGHPLGCT